MPLFFFYGSEAEGEENIIIGHFNAAEREDSFLREGNLEKEDEGKKKDEGVRNSVRNSVRGSV
jgi:hypothetical protein